MNITKQSRSHVAACWLVLVATLAVMFSPALTNLAEFLLILLMLAVPDLRTRLVRAWSQPLFKAALAFWLVVGIGVFYSVAPLDDRLSFWGGWRKLLLLPLALSLFDSPERKRWLAQVFVIVCTLMAVASFGTWFMDVVTIHQQAPGVLARNRASQGMYFAVAACTAIMLLYHEKKTSWWLAVSAGLLVANIAFVTPGRSGYVVLLTCVATFLLWWLSTAGFTWKNLAGAALALVFLASLLALAPTSRGRIAEGLEEMHHYQQEQQYTSMGIRMIFWKNTLQLLQQRPLTGFGTGGFGPAYAKMVAGRTGLEGLATGDPHNQYMKILVEHGVPGFLVFLSMIVAALFQRTSTPWRLLGLGVLAGWCATSLANSHFSTFNEGTFLYLWLGTMLAEERLTRT